MKPRPAAVRSMVDRKRREHPELRGDLTYAGVIAVIKREGILFSEHRITAEGRSINLMGDLMIVINPSLAPDPRYRLSVLCHEFGHITMGHLFHEAVLAKRAVELDAVWVERPNGKWFYDANPSPTEDALEAEADLFAQLMLAGTDLGGWEDPKAGGWCREGWS